MHRRNHNDYFYIITCKDNYYVILSGLAKSDLFRFRDTSEEVIFIDQDVLSANIS
jgi:hypothetical protein